jgi:hypothetical protein
MHIIALILILENKKRHISMLKVKLYFFSSFFLVEVVRFFVTYGLARNKTGSVKDGITELYQKTHSIINIHNYKTIQYYKIKK